MESTLSVFFMCLCGISLLLVLVALFRSLSALLARSSPAAAELASGAERDALLGEKRSLLQTLRDLEFERETGKLSDADFERLNTRYRARARDVLRALDQQLSEFRAEATELIAAELSKLDGEPPDASAAAGGEGETSPQRTCAGCETDNDADAVFCKKCGKPFDAAASESAAESESAADGESDGEGA